MKPKFALDLSHEGINLLHRSKGGWSLVGSVDLDDPEMGTHLADLRRRAAALESGGVTCKIIIPNSQILYTTIEAPGPDDIAREVQIRSGLDGLTPYPVGELVFDWRAAGERARVAVLARDTMDEAENFAAEHKFNPVSFVARPPQGEFSGEPFFGKTRAATKILGPSERVEPDPSPVPRKPTAMAAPTAPATPTTRAVPVPPETWQTDRPDTPSTPQTSGALTWEPPTEAATDPAPEPSQDPAPPREAAPEPQEPLRRPIDPSDDPFAELDAIQAELSGDPAAASAFRARAYRDQQPRPGDQPSRSGEQPVAPPLAPFPPTSDEADALPPPSQTARRSRGSGDASAGQTGTPQKPTTPPQPDTARPAPDKAPPQGGASSDQRSKPDPSRQAPDAQPGADAAGADDTPEKPGVSFTTRRNSSTGATSTVATPTSRGAASEPAPRSASGSAPSSPAAPGQPSDRRDTSASDRRRADMAAALARPLPGSPTAKTGPKEGTEGTARGSLSGALKGAADGLRSFSQRRATNDSPKPADQSPSNEQTPGSTDTATQTGPASRGREPDLLDPRIADTGDTRPSDSRPPDPRPVSGGARTPVPPADDATKAKPAPKPTPAVPPAPARQAAAAQDGQQDWQSTRPADAAPQTTAKTPLPAPAAPTPAIPAIATRSAGTPPERGKDSASEAEALTVFGARRGSEQRGRRKYLGLILTLLLLLAMAVIALWSSLFVDDGDPVLFNPGDEASVPAPDGTPDETAPPEPATPDEDPTTAPDTPEESAPEAPAPDETGAPTPQVLSEEEAEAQYADTQIWQRAPETLGEPFTPGLELGDLGGPGPDRSDIADPGSVAGADTATAPPAETERAAPVPPPPADTVFDVDESGLVNPSPEGTVSPTGVVVFEGPPELVPPTRPAPPALPEPAPDAPDAVDPAAEPDTPDPLEQAVEEALEDVSSLGDQPSSETPEAGEAAPDADAAAEADPQAETDAAVDLAAADPEALESAVDVVATSFVDATEFAVETSLKPTRRPANIDAIATAAIEAAAAAPPVVAEPSAVTTPAIPTSASVANQATTPNALDLREINLLGISGPTNARRALVRMANGRYITVKVGDRLDGGRVTSITSDGLTYQKGARNLSLQLLPLG